MGEPVCSLLDLGRAQRRVGSTPKRAARTTRPLSPLAMDVRVNVTKTSTTASLARASTPGDDADVRSAAAVIARVYMGLVLKEAG